MIGLDQAWESNGWQYCSNSLTHWGRVTYICVGKLTIIGSDNGLSPGRRQAIIWTYEEILLIRPYGTNFSAILIGNQTFSFKKMHLKMSSAKWRPFCLGLNVSRISNIIFQFGGVSDALIEFCLFHGIWNFSMIGLDQVWEMMSHCSSSKNFRSQPEIWWADPQYYEANSNKID